MKELEKEFTGKGDESGFRFIQIDRTETHAFYKVYNSSSGNKTHYYEIVRIKKQKAHISMINGKRIFHVEKEIYPSGNGFNQGCDAFCVIDFFDKAAAMWLKLK